MRRKARLLSSHEGMILFDTTVLFSQWITLTSSVTDLFITSQCKDILQLVYKLSDQGGLRNSGAFFLKRKVTWMGRQHAIRGDSYFTESIGLIT